MHSVMYDRTEGQGFSRSWNVPPRAGEGPLKSCVESCRCPFEMKGYMLMLQQSPFRPYIEARLLFKSAKLYQQSLDRGPTGSSGQSNANITAVDLTFYSALLLVRFFSSSSKYCPFLLCPIVMFRVS